MNIKNFKKNQPVLNQTVINEDKSKFIIAKKFANFTSIITPFNKINNKFNSDFSIPHSRAQRIQYLYNLMINIAEYSTTNNYIDFDCVGKLPLEIFENYDNGIIHFNIQNKSIKNDNNDLIIEMDPRLIINTVTDNEIIEYDNKSKILFTTNHIKVFSVLLSKGVIITIVDQDECIIYLTLLNPNKGYIGTCIRKEIANITQNIFPIWPIFNIVADENINKIFLKKELLENIKTSSYQKLMLKIKYNFTNPSLMFIEKIGYNYT